MQYQYYIKGDLIEIWSSVRSSIGDGHDVTKAKEIVEGAPNFVFSVLKQEPWSPCYEGQGTQFGSWLSHGRNL